MNKKEAFSRGFARGNYGNAYESQDWESWYADNCDPPDGCEAPEAYAAGCLLGFFSSYEIHEIGDPDVAEAVEALRGVYGDA
jgi:hypothetical protein